jgi:hypothetical protein
MTIAMTVGATRIQLLQESCLNGVDESMHQGEKASPKAYPEQASGT